MRNASSDADWEERPALGQAPAPPVPDRVPVAWQLVYGCHARLEVRAAHRRRLARRPGRQAR